MCDTMCTNDCLWSTMVRYYFSFFFLSLLSFLISIFNVIKYFYQSIVAYCGGVHNIKKKAEQTACEEAIRNL